MRDQSQPVVIVMVEDAAVRTTISAAIDRRYGADYEILGVENATTDLAELLDALVGQGRSVALALAPIRPAGVEYLSAVRDRFPTVRRIAMVDVGDTSVADEINQALTLNRLDAYAGYPWASPEEEIYPVTGEALRRWTHDQQMGFTKVTVVDEPGGSRGRELANWLNRNDVTTVALTTDSPEGRSMADGQLAGLDLPAVLLYDGRTISRPADDILAEALGASTRPGDDAYDVTIVGAGPAGLAAATYAAAEGLRTVVIEKLSIGGQAGTSSMIRNYLGFRWGVSGRDLVVGASRQAEQLGANFVLTRAATSIVAVDGLLEVTLDSEDVARSGTVILTGGVAYRRLGIPSVDELVGNGVFYGAGPSEAATMGGLHVAVLGAGNSAGQAACALAAAGAEVTMVVRGSTLASKMSDYLVEQVTHTKNIDVRYGAHIEQGIGYGHLEGLVVSTQDGPQTLQCQALFVFIGARPHTEWLEGSVDTDDNGFVLTGRDLPQHSHTPWLGTSIDGVFAAGDIRFGSIKRVAAAVGEGSTAAMLALDHLAS